MYKTDICQWKIGFHTKTTFVSSFLARITNFSGSQLGEKKKGIVRNLLEKYRIYEISLEFIFGTFGPGKVLEIDIFDEKCVFHQNRLCIRHSS